MRKVLCSLGLLSFLTTFPVAAQWLPSTASFVQGSQNNLAELVVAVPEAGISAFEGLSIEVSYDGTVFQPLGLTFLSTGYDQYFDFNLSGIGLADPGCSDCRVPISIFPNFNMPGFGLDGIDIPGPGVLLRVQARFNVLPTAPLGTTTVRAYFDTENGYVGDLPVQATIVAVPEPETWATMLAGLVLIGGLVARRRA